MDGKLLHKPLLPTVNTALDDINSTSTTTSSIVQRLVLVMLIAVISIWANNEASKGFEIRVINDMKGTPVGDKFSLFYVCNDEAIRLVQSAATSAAKTLNSDGYMPEKIIEQVDIRLARVNLTSDYMVVTKSSEEKNKYVISLSPLIMEFADFRVRVKNEIRKGMAEVLLFDNRGKALKTLMDGLVEYINNVDG